MTGSPRRKIIDALHEARMQPYLAAAHHVEKHALTLYRWHGELTAAVQTVLAVTEVVLRNAMDRELQLWNQSEPDGSLSWLLTAPAAPLRGLSSGKRIDAIKRAEAAHALRGANHRRHGHPVSHDDVLAQTSFSLWRELLPNHVPNAGDTSENRGRELLWRQALSNAFANAPDPDGALTFWRVTHLYSLRNRVSHMEPLLDRDC